MKQDSEFSEGWRRDRYTDFVFVGIPTRRAKQVDSAEGQGGRQEIVVTAQKSVRILPEVPNAHRGTNRGYEGRSCHLVPVA